MSELMIELGYELLPSTDAGIEAVDAILAED